MINITSTSEEYCLPSDLLLPLTNFSKEFSVMLRATALLCLIMLSNSFLCAQEPPPAATPEFATLNIERAPVHDLAHLLQITKLSGDFQLKSPAQRATLAIEIYHNGQRIDTLPKAEASLGLGGGILSGEFSVQIADLDYLKLGDSKPRHCRVLLNIALRGENEYGATRDTEDIPKGSCDLTLLNGFVTTRSHDATADRIPLFCLAGPNAQYLSSSVEQVLEKNPEANVLVAYLVLE
jgi:hypothetical protein